MNLDQVRALFPSGYLVDVEILKNPGNLSEWFILVMTSSGKTYLVEDEQGQIRMSRSVDPLLDDLHRVGFHQVTVHI